MNFQEALKEFGKYLGRLKRAYEEEFGCNSNYLQIFIDEDNYMMIVPSNEAGRYIECFRDWINTEQ